MSTHSDSVSDASSPARVMASPDITLARQLYWSVRRELWESRSIYVAPLALAAVFLFGFAMSTIHLAQKLRAAALGPAQQHEALAQPYGLAAMLIMATTFVVGVFYSLDALYGERRDRSILFWKSLPVSDLITVLSKASIPLLVLPLLTVAVTFGMHLIMLLLSSAVLLGSGQSATPLWTRVPLLQMTLAMLHHMVVVHALWHAPIYGWLLLISAWARRAPVLWAILPPLAIGVTERIAFNTSHLGALLGSHLAGGADGVTSAAAGHVQAHPLADLAVSAPLSSPGLWLGLAFTAIFLAAAVRLRRDRGPN